jgi:hypothetical protein
MGGGSVRDVTGGCDGRPSPTKELKVNECNGDITPPTRNLPIHARLPLMAGVRKPRKNRLVTAAASVVLVIVLFSGW